MSLETCLICGNNEVASTVNTETGQWRSVMGRKTMRHAYLCGDDVRVEFFPNKGVASLIVSVDGDLEERSSAPCDPKCLRSVLNGMKYHVAGEGWMCSLIRHGESVELELWRDGAAKKRCRIPVDVFEQAVEQAFGARLAYVA